MKAKIFIVIIAILGCLSTSSLYARKKAIIMQEQFTTDERMKWDEEERSIPNSIPFILHNETTFYIYSYDLLEEVKLTIKDRYNNIVYSTVDTILPHEDNMFTLDIEKGKYTIELESKEGIYYGYFEITK